MCLLWRNVYLNILPISFLLGIFVVVVVVVVAIELFEMFYALEIKSLLVILFANSFS